MEFFLGSKAGRKEIIAALAQHFTVRSHKQQALTRTLYDTFDWRLYAAGQRIEDIRHNGEVVSRWIENGTGTVLAGMQAPAGRMARDWQPPSLAEALEKAIKIRALLPLGKVETTLWAADLLDSRDKTVARLQIDFSTIGEGGARKPLPPVARLTPVRGYGAQAKKAAAVLAGLPDVIRPETAWLESALAASGRRPLDYSSKINVTIAASDSCEEAVRRVLSRLLETIADNRNGAAKAIDTEFLHDFRVAVRRTRSMLGQMKDCIPGPVLKRFRPEFDWLGGVTGPVRDLDVYLLKLDGYTAALDDDTRRDLAPLKKYLLRRLRREQRKLAREISGARYRRLAASWAKALQAPWASDEPGWCGLEPARAMAGRRILKILKRALRQGSALTDASPSDDVHQLRITCKKLRYLMEFFKSLFHAEEIDALTGVLKDLQDVLGDHQDFEVHRGELVAFAEEMGAEKAAAPRTLLAMGRLSENLAGRQRAVRAGLCDSFTRFADKRNVARYRGVFKPAGDGPPDENTGNV